VGAGGVVVPLEVAAVAEIALASVPIAGGGEAVNQGAVVQHGQVEAAAVPTDQLRRMAFDKVEKLGDHFLFAVVHFTYGADVDFVLPPTHTAGNGDHLVQVVLHKVRAVLGAAFLLGEQDHLVVRQRGRQVVQQADAVHIRYGFNIESQNRGHGRLLKFSQNRLKQTTG